MAVTFVSFPSNTHLRYCDSTWTVRYHQISALNVPMDKRDGRIGVKIVQPCKKSTPVQKLISTAAAQVLPRAQSRNQVRREARKSDISPLSRMLSTLPRVAYSRTGHHRSSYRTIPKKRMRFRCPMPVRLAICKFERQSWVGLRSRDAAQPSFFKV